MPYDYAATFELTGRPGTIIQDVINISPDGVFVATAIGYGLEEDRERALKIPPQGSAPPPSFVPGDIPLGQIPQDALIEGFRVNPRLESVVFAEPSTLGGTALREKLFSKEPVSISYMATFLQQMKSQEEISFLFSIVDTASGRELQDEPIHNLASLGKSNGERPFRLLAKPLSFLPRSTVRLQIIEQSEGVKGTLFIVLYGYRILQESDCSESQMRRLRGSPAYPAAVGRPDRIIPFDYVAKLELTGRAGNLVEEEVSINVEGGFVATALGYGLVVDAASVPLNVPDTLITAQRTFDLAQVPLRSFASSALSDGVRIRREFLRLAFENNGGLAADLPVGLAGKIFERLNRTEAVSFRYAIFDTGRGRELQNQPIHNIAGLGIANGDRPFKTFARPMVFRPRSTVRIAVEEHFGRGTLYLVFQGYKILRAT
jgi:hypothetical protein